MFPRLFSPGEIIARQLVMDVVASHSSDKVEKSVAFIVVRAVVGCLQVRYKYYDMQWF